MTASLDPVVLARGEARYPRRSPFHPSERYPEYPFAGRPEAISEEPNEVYPLVRDVLRGLGLDSARFGTTGWNPLGELVRPGGTILLKPNWVSHFVHGGGPEPENVLECLVTHTSVLRAVLDYAFLAVGPAGKIVLADAPIQGTDFQAVLERAGVNPLLDFCRAAGVPAETLDLRLLRTDFLPDGRMTEHARLVGDPQGYVLAKVDGRSALGELDARTGLYRVIGYDASEMSETHGPGRHRYLLSRSALAADLLVNLPKLKTHIKCGMTAALKNLVGINGNKAFLPHYRLGSPREHGDDYPTSNLWLYLRSRYQYRVAHWPRLIRDPLRAIARALLRPSRPATGEPDPYLLSGGSWHGNDTAWRMVVDLNLAVRYADLDGELGDVPRRRWLSIVDGLVGGEGNGPLSPRARPLGALVAGWNPAAVDAVCARLIGLDWRALPSIAKGAGILFGETDLASLAVRSADGAACRIADLAPTPFRAPDGWKGKIELEAGG